MSAQSTEEQEVPKHAGGRPVAFNNFEDLEVAIAAYFDACDPHMEDRLVDSGVNQKGETIFLKRKIMTEQKPYTMSGLARALGVHRTTIRNYAKNAEYFITIAAARSRCEEYWEGRLDSPYSSGAKFNLSNNYEDWSDKREITGKDGSPLVGALVEFVGDDRPEPSNSTD